ncbi:MAG: hypothetical protein RIS35_3756 [Pseudomonadota bacterium]|jgi:hypothetical protein
MALTKTGEILFLDENGDKWLSESYVNEETGEVTTQQIMVEAAPSEDATFSKE